MAPSRRTRGSSILKTLQLVKARTPSKRQRPGTSVLKSQPPSAASNTPNEARTQKVEKKGPEDPVPDTRPSRPQRTRRSIPSPELEEEEPPTKLRNLGNNASQKSLKCCFCQKQLKDIDAFVLHCNNLHSQKICDLWLQCHVCNTYVPSERVLKSHCKTEHHVMAKEHILLASELYFCELCGQEFNQTMNLSQHARIKHKEILEFTWIPCKICNVMFKWQAWLDKHLEKSHKQLKVNVVRVHKRREKQKSESAVLPKYKPIVCKLCPSSFFDPCMYVQHANVFHRGQIMADWVDCPKCGLLLPTRDALQFHLIMYHDEEDQFKNKVRKTKPVKCFSCVSTFFDPFASIRHANEIHLEEIDDQWHICQACDQYFPSVDILLIHSFFVHEDINLGGQSKIYCDFCDEEFNEPYAYYDHVNSGHKIDLGWKACGQCDKFFPNVEALQFHVVISHNVMKNKKDSSIVWLGVLNSKKYVLQCVECEFTFIDPLKYHSHANKDHLEELKASWIECELCQMIFPSDDILLYHNLFYHGKRSLLRQEWEKILTVSEPVAITQLPECQLCNLKFANEKLLELHISKHSASIKIKEKPAKCQFCNTNFPSKSLYYNHANANHKNLIETFWTKCTLCKMYLPSKSDFHIHFFDAHLPAHEKRSSHISCGFCTLKFRNKRKLIEHANKWHQKLLAGKWVECEFCQMFVMNKHQLFYHTKQVHADKLPPTKTWSCKSCKKVFISERRYSSHKACDESSDSEMDDEADNSEDDSNEKIREKSGNKMAIKDSNDVDMSDDDFEDSKFDLDATVDPEVEEFVLANNEVEDPESVLKLVGKGRGKPVFCQFCLVVFDSMNLYLHHAKYNHQSQVEKLWTKCRDCGHYFPDDEVLASHKYKYHEHPSDDESDEEPIEPPEKPKLKEHILAKLKESPSGPLKVTMNVGKRKIEMQLKVDGDVSFEDGQTSLVMDTSKLRKTRGPRTKPYGSKLGKDVDRQKMISQKRDRSKKKSASEKDPNEAYKCVPCNKVFHKKNYLRKHDNRFHRVERSCEKCGKMFLYQRDFERHSAQESCDEPKKTVFVCSVCDKTFSMKYRLVSHMNLVHTKRSAHYKCRICSRTFAMAAYLKSHCFRVHKLSEDDPESLLETAVEDQTDPSKDESKPIERPDGEFECKDCGKRFAKREYATRHFKLMHTELQMRECQICFKSFPIGSSFNKHVRRVHMRGYEVDCGICTRTFSNPSSLRIHLKTVHRRGAEQEQNTDDQVGEDTRTDEEVNEEPILSCDTCNVTFTDTQSLRNHFEFVHANQYTVQCQHCQEIFDDLDALEIHVNNDHLSSRSYKCSCCEMVFAERSVCEEHIMAVHMQNETFTCKYCEEAFDSEELLEAHIPTHETRVVFKEDLNDEEEVAVRVKYEPSIVVELVPFGVPQNTNVDENVFYDTVH